jgi:hypothetical protein
MAAADAVDLPRIGVAHGGEHQRVARGGVRGQVLRVEERGLGGAAAHEHAGQRAQVRRRNGIGFGGHAQSVAAMRRGRVEFRLHCVLT